MKNFLKYPRTTSELHRLINFLDSHLVQMEKIKDKKHRSRDWMRICQSINDILKESTLKTKESEENNKIAKQNLAVLKYATTTLDISFHNKVSTTIQKWMMSKGFPIW